MTRKKSTLLLLAALSPLLLSATKDKAAPSDSATAKRAHNFAYQISKQQLWTSTSLFAADYIETKDQEDTYLWKLLRYASTNIGSLVPLSNLAREQRDNKIAKAEFGTDWNYYVAVAKMQDGKDDDAVTDFARIQLQDRFFSHALYLKAMILLEQGKVAESKSTLRAILLPETRRYSALNRDGEERLLAYTNLALARIHYQAKEFEESIIHYRKIPKSTAPFYRALFEQSWALFLAGFPKHALGSLYGAKSPFFKELYNPEATLLKAIIYYWLCNYDEAKDALAEFSEEYEVYAKDLTNYTKRLRFTDMQSFNLFEDYVSGVSAQALGVDRRLLGAASMTESMLLIREQYATLLRENAELAKLQDVDMELRDQTVKLQEDLLRRMKKMIGKRFLTGLASLQRDFERQNEQAQFLQVELLLSEKDHLLGKTAQAGLAVQESLKQEVENWAKRSQSWAVDRRNEYWWDELGYHLVPVENRCLAANTKGRP